MIMIIIHLNVVVLHEEEDVGVEGAEEEDSAVVGVASVAVAAVAVAETLVHRMVGPIMKWPVERKEEMLDMTRLQELLPFIRLRSSKPITVVSEDAAFEDGEEDAFLPAGRTSKIFWPRKLGSAKKMVKEMMRLAKEPARYLKLRKMLPKPNQTEMKTMSSVVIGKDRIVMIES